MRRLLLPAVLAGALLCGTGGPASAAQREESQGEAAGEVAEDPSKFFVFHLEGVSFEQAQADYLYCIDQAQPVLSMRDKMGTSGGGLLGALINGRMAEIDRTRMRNAIMRRCMGMIGYARYRMPEAEWNVMVEEGDIVVGNDGVPHPPVIERLARYASGPTPQTERLDP